LRISFHKKPQKKPPDLKKRRTQSQRPAIRAGLFFLARFWALFL
jgi:hypothetical protein